MRNNLKFGVSIIWIITGCLVMGCVLGCEAKKSQGQTLEQLSNSQAQSTVQEIKPVEITPWDESFNVSWIGSYKSRSTADYAVVFDLSSDGTYKLTYGENINIATTYSGKYNKNFNGGISRSRLNYTIMGLSVTDFDEKSITIRCRWRLPEPIRFFV